MYLCSGSMFRVAGQCLNRVTIQQVRAMGAVKTKGMTDTTQKQHENGRVSNARSDGGAAMVRGFQGGEHQFSGDRAREILAANAECGQLEGHHQVHNGGHTNSNGHTQDAGRDAHVDKYDSHGSVSLYSVMQSNVPEPFNPHGRNPTHLNMPGGGVKLGDKYLSDKRVAASERRRKYSTSAPASTEIDFQSDMASPQGVQGDNSDCSTYKLWLENCQKYGFASCVEQLQGVQTGRKTLQEVFAEQQALIHEIALSHQQNQSLQQGVQDETGRYADNKYEDPDVQGVQGDIPNLSLQELSALSNPCPQGVQGDDCIRFKLWLQNCAHFGFGECEEQLQDLKGGRRTLQDIFEEQDKLIRDAVLQYSSSVPPETGPASGSNPERN